MDVGVINQQFLLSVFGYIEDEKDEEEKRKRA